MPKPVKGDWKSPTFDGRCPSVIDWAQMAAFIDGEGSILINTQKWLTKTTQRKTFGLYLRVTVANTDVRLMQWCKERFGGAFKDANTDLYYVGKNWKRSYHWGTSSHRAAWVLYNCLPHFVLKKEQAEIGISLQESLALYVPGSGELPGSVKEERKALKDRLRILKSKGIKGIPVPSGPIEDTA